MRIGPDRYDLRRRILLPACIVLATQGEALAASQDLFDLSLGELLQLEVTSVSKKSQPVSEAAAAVFVITAEDIRRSGATTIPEALRMAPGIEVAQVDANKWAISARGLQSRFANKLLVLMDGRTLYSPLFSGVFWDAQDTFMEDIERIEVIRGPGATLWNSNAVNGVINIITRSASDSTGMLASVGGGDQENGFAGIRYGASLGAAGDFRAYAKHFSRDGNRVAETGAPAGDDWQQSRIGFRADLDVGAAAALTLQGDAYRGRSGETVATIELEPPYRALVDDEQSLSGFNLLARWRSTRANGDVLSVQGFIDTARRDWAISDLDRTTTDLDIDYRLAGFGKHDVLLGANYRYTRDQIARSQRLVTEPQSRDEELISAFLQDDWTLVPDTLSLVAGVKIELNDYTGYEVQPNLRMLWRPNDSTSLWASVARAVRTPGRLDRDSQLLADIVPPADAAELPLLRYVNGNRDFEAETLIAYEAGLKHEVGDGFSWDLALYYNDYDDIRSFTPGGLRCVPEGALPSCLFAPGTSALGLDTQWTNVGSVQSYGFEWAGNWQLSPAWGIKAAYSFSDERSSAPGDSLPEVPDGDPRNQLSLRVAHQPSASVDMDLWLRYVDDIATLRDEIDAYTTLDARIAWRPRRNTEVSLNGRNLLHADRVQFRSELDDVPLIAIQRSVHLQLSVQF